MTLRMKIRSKSEPQLFSPLISSLLQVPSRDRASDGLERQLTTTRIGFSTHELLAGHALSAVAAYGGLVGAYIRNANVLGETCIELVPFIPRSTNSMHPSSFAYRISTASPRPPHGEQNLPGARTLRGSRRAAASTPGGSLPPPPPPPFPNVRQPFCRPSLATL